MNSSQILENSKKTMESSIKTKINLMLIEKGLLTEEEEKKEEIQYEYSINDEIDVLIKMKNPKIIKASENSKASGNKKGFFQEV